ncbi:MAG: DUF420 domain-containing protein [Vicinamibacterales bacterium]
MSVHDLPAVNATLNAISGILLLIGYSQIKAGRRDAHKNWMLAAFTCSALFLVCYVIYHAEGWLGAVHSAGVRYGRSTSRSCSRMSCSRSSCCR